MAHYESKILSLGIMNEDNDLHNTIQSLDISIRTSYERDRKRAAVTIGFPDNFSFQSDDTWISSSFLLKITTSYRDLDGDYDEAEESFAPKACQMEKQKLKIEVNAEDIKEFADFEHKVLSVFPDNINYGGGANTAGREGNMERPKRELPPEMTEFVKNILEDEEPEKEDDDGFEL